jgi:hypothetical protein
MGVISQIRKRGEKADQKHFDLGRCSIHNADIYIVYSPFGDSENRGKKLLKIGFIRCLVCKL